ncbi:very short patch repair endonuclease [Enterococcus sp. LJL90]
MKHPKLETTPSVSRRMANVKLKGGKAETILAKSLWHNNVRYRKNYKKLPGSPDIAITKYKIAIFVDGEFWHGENWEARKKNLKRNRDYWIEKIEENISRDKRNDLLLNDLGWTPLHFWEKEVLKRTDFCLDVINRVINEKKIE